MNEKEFINILKKLSPRSKEVAEAINILIKNVIIKELSLTKTNDINIKSEKNKSFILNIDENNISKLNQILGNLENGLDLEAVKALIEKINNDVEKSKKEYNSIKEKEQDKKEQEDKEKTDQERDEEERAKEKAMGANKKAEEEEKRLQEKESLDKEQEKINKEAQRKDEEITFQEEKEKNDKEQKEKKDKEELEKKNKDQKERKDDKNDADVEDNKNSQKEKDKIKKILKNLEIDDKRLEDKSFTSKLIQKRAEMEDAKKLMNDLNIKDVEGIKQMRAEMDNFLKTLNNMLSIVLSQGGNGNEIVNSISLVEGLIKGLDTSLFLLSDLALNKI